MIALFEKVLENPDTIIVQNIFYPKGLIEQNIYNYYIQNKKEILSQINNREIMIFFAVDKNNFIIKRKINNNFIKLDNTNYDKIINGRTVSIHSTMNDTEKFGIIDIDFHNFDKAKEATLEIYNFLYKINKKLQIRFTGKDSFHIIYNFSSYNDINKIREFLKNQLAPLAGNYIINGIRNESKINIDLSSNKYRGGFITLNALSILGLKCMEVSPDNILNFNKNMARI